VNKRATIDFKKRLGYLMQAFKLPESLSRVALTTGRNEVEFVNVNRIIYCEAEGFYTTFHLENQNDILVCKNLKEYEKLLPEQFIRIHKSYLINKNKIKKISRADGGYIVMDNEKVLPIGRKKEQFIKSLME
jgi:two-component system LytT family response regulator